MLSISYLKGLLKPEMNIKTSFNLLLSDSQETKKNCGRIFCGQRAKSMAHPHVEDVDFQTDLIGLPMSEEKQEETCAELWALLYCTSVQVSIMSSSHLF